MILKRVLDKTKGRKIIWKEFFHKKEMLLSGFPEIQLKGYESNIKRACFSE